jgi:hypothetical protein
MNLYEVKTWHDENRYRRFTTQFVSSLKEAKSLVRGHKRWRINQVTIKDRLSRQELIFLLEGDAPGEQSQVMTPIDLIMHRQLFKEKQ